MKQAFTRRDFFGYGGGLFASLALASHCARSAMGASASRLTVSVRDAMLGHTGEKDCWAGLKRIGSEGVEVAVDDESRCQRGRSEDHRLVHVQSFRGTSGPRGPIVHAGG
jgi:hypothetical protein